MKYLFLGSDPTIKYVGKSTKGGKAIVLLGIMYALAGLVFVLVWTSR